MTKACIVHLFLLFTWVCVGQEANWTSLYNIQLGADVVAVKKDPLRSFVYAVDKSNSEVLFIDLDQKVISKRLYVGKSPTCVDIDESGDYLYVGNGGSGSGVSGSFEIAKVDLDTQEVVSSFSLPSSVYAIENITCGSGNVIYYNAGYASWNLGMARMINSSSGADLGALAKIKSPMVLSADKTKLYGQYVYSGNLGEMGVWDVSVTPIQKLDRYPYAPYASNYGWAYNNYCISEDGTCLALGKILFNPDDLEDHYGEFTELIYALSRDGSIAFGKTAIWDTTTFSVHGDATKLADLPFTTTIMHFDPVGGRLYAYDSANQSVHAIAAPDLGKLLISLPQSVFEADGVLTGEVSVLQAPDYNLSVSLTSDDPTEIALETNSIVIPAGSLSAAFRVAVQDDTDLDGPQSVTITASAVGCESATNDIIVYDNEGYDLMLSLAESATEGDGIITGMVTLGMSPTTNLTVYLSSDDSSEIVLTNELAFSPGQTNASFTVQVQDDLLLDGSQQVLVDGWATGYTRDRREIRVDDNESAVLTLSLPQTTYEGAGTVSGVLMLNSAPDEDVAIELHSDNPSKIQGKQLIVAAGQSFVPFILNVNDDDLIDGIQTATITARVHNWSSGQATLFIFDNESTVLSLDLPSSAVEGDGILTNAATVSASGIVMADLHVMLTSSDTSELSVPATLTIPAGSSSAAFDCVITDDAESDGTQRVNVVAQSPDYVPASGYLSVLDNEAHHIVISGLSGDIPLYDATAVTVSVETVDNLLVPGYSEQLALSAAGDRGAVAVTPDTVTNMVDGLAIASVSFGNIGNDIQLIAGGGGLAGTSTVFNVTGSQIVISPVDLTNTLVVSGEILTRTLVISNAGNAELEFEIQGLSDGSGGEETTNSLNAGLAVYYPFDGDAMDASGNGIDGIVEGATLIADRDGIPDSAYRFDEGAYIRTTASSGPADITGQISMAAWISPEQFTVKSGGVGVVRTIIRKRSMYNSYGYNFGLNESGRLTVVFGNSSSPDVATADMAPLPTNQWTHVAVTYDGAQVVFYINGIPADVQAYNEPLLSTSETLCLGRLTDSNDQAYFYGGMDEVRIYDRVLTDEEMQALFAYDNNGIAAIDGLIASYPFSGDAADVSGNGHDGTVDGATLTDDRFGNADSAYHFDGVNDYIDLGTLGDFQTVSIWVRQATRSEYDFYLGHDAFRLFASTANSGRLSFGNGSGSLTTSVSMDARLNEWVHIVAVNDGADSRVYLNGTNVTTVGMTMSPPPAGTVNLGRWVSGTHYLNGDLDDIRIYDRALTEQEVQQLYQETDTVLESTDIPVESSSESGDLDSGLVAFYPLDGDASDLSSNAYHGAIIGATLMTNRFGDVDSAYYFDGVNDRIDLPTPVLDFERTEPFSQSFWLKSSDTDNGNNILAKMMTSSTARGYNVVLANGILRVQLIYYNIIDNKIQVEGTTSLNDDTWHHIVVTYDGSSSASGVAVYIDGNPESLTVVRNSLTGTILNSNTPTLGSRNSDYYYNGALDDVRIYDRVLTEQEVEALYTDGDRLPEVPWLTGDPLSGTVPPATSVVVQVKFDAAGMIAGDYSNTVTMVLCNDATSPSNTIAASMYVLPAAPGMNAEPEATSGTFNEVSWSTVEGPVDYRVEAAVTTNSAALQQSDWQGLTSFTFESLEPGTIYYYRARAGVQTDIGVLEGPWSGWVWSMQVDPLGDSDGDGIIDGWEFLHFGNLTSADALTDSDGDGQPDLNEFIAGMDPTDSASSFVIYDAAIPAEGGFVVYWDAMTGRVYSVHWTDSMTNAFETIASGLVYPQGSYTDTVHQAEESGFYQVEVEME